MVRVQWMSGSNALCSHILRNSHLKHEESKKKCSPVALRLMNEHFLLGFQLVNMWWISIKCSKKRKKAKKRVFHENGVFRDFVQNFPELLQLCGLKGRVEKFFSGQFI